MASAADFLFSYVPLLMKWPVWYGYSSYAFFSQIVTVEVRQKHKYRLGCDKRQQSLPMNKANCTIIVG